MQEGRKMLQKSLRQDKEIKFTQIIKKKGVTIYSSYTFFLYRITQGSHPMLCYVVPFRAWLRLCSNLRHCARYAKSSSDSSQHCRGKIPQKLNKPRFVLLSHTFVLHNFNCSTFLYPQSILSTDYHRFTQILNIKDILIITD